MVEFSLHPRLAIDTQPIGHLPLCAVRLSNDARYPWVLLIPRRAELRELHDLELDDRLALWSESCAVSAAMMKLFAADKMNIAALGNMVPQLHIHHIARFETDDAWPGAVWGAHPSEDYDAEGLADRLASLQGAFARIEGFRPLSQRGGSRL